MQMKNKEIQFLLVNNTLVVLALIEVAFEQVGIYVTFFAISVALQVSQFKKVNT